MHSAALHPSLHSVVEGDGPLVLLSHALGCDLGMWDEVCDHLRHRFRVLRYDHRGHGRSAHATQAFSIEDLADDAAALLRRSGHGPAHVVGLSMGGMMAQAFAVRHPDLARSLVVANACGRYDGSARDLWAQRAALVRARGTAAIADAALQRWLTPEFRQASPSRVARLRQCLERTDAQSYALSCEAVSAIDVLADNVRIACPTLVIAGTRDEATPPLQSQLIRDAIPGAGLVQLQASHLSAVEQPLAFVQALEDFWGAIPDRPTVS